MKFNILINRVSVRVIAFGKLLIECLNNRAFIRNFSMTFEKINFTIKTYNF